MKIKTIIITAILFFVCGSNAYADTILQNQFNGTFQIKDASPIGQTFTAEDAKVASIGFNIRKVNNGTLPLDIELFEGVGNTGLSLGSSPVLGLTSDSNGFFDADFGLATLSVGDTYTAIISADSVRWGVRFFSWNNPGDNDPYIGGNMWVKGTLSTDVDLTFRVTPFLVIVCDIIPPTHTACVKHFD